MTIRRKILAFLAGAVGVLSMLVAAGKVLFAQQTSGVPIVQTVMARGNEQGIIIFLLGVAITLMVVHTFDFWVPFEKKLEGIGSAPELLDSEAAIYARASSLVSGAERSVRAATFRRVHEPRRPGYWKALVRRNASNPIDYTLLYGYGDTTAVRAAAQSHAAYFAQSGGMAIAQLYIASPVGVDLLIVDGTALMLALPVVKNDPNVRRAVCIRDGELVRDLAAWFDNYLTAESSQQPR